MDSIGTEVASWRGRDRWRARQRGRERVDDPASPAFLGALHALAINDGGRRARLTVATFAPFSIERMMHSIQRVVEAPQVQIIENGAAWGKILGKRPPLASRAQNGHDPVHDLTDVDPAPVAADLGRWNHRFDPSPFFIGQVTRHPKEPRFAVAKVGGLRFGRGGVVCLPASSDARSPDRALAGPCDGLHPAVHRFLNRNSRLGRHAAVGSPPGG
jgi:hypothetical protein